MSRTYRKSWIDLGYGNIETYIKHNVGEKYVFGLRLRKTTLEDVIKEYAESLRDGCPVTFKMYGDVEKHYSNRKIRRRTKQDLYRYINKDRDDISFCDKKSYKDYIW
ncbi:MAG: hypothetical protein COA52_01215 [Hyphomicrobiales bacterium]|nr:MAG: hypothetical protein COA52_00125 [Hyphomicrobiales bacterium]PCJ96855.1 MAG: hypothetical protein COA52_01215 [Hyphomicrobiales bacterium]